VRCLDAFEFVHQRVVGGVADFRRVENVIQVLVAAQFGAQFVGALVADESGVVRSPMGRIIGGRGAR